MNDRIEKIEKIVKIISELKDPFYDTPDRFFVALAGILIKHNFSENDVRLMVSHTIETTVKTRLTVADVLDTTLNRKRYEYL